MKTIHAFAVATVPAAACVAGAAPASAGGRHWDHHHARHDHHFTRKRYGVYFYRYEQRPRFAQPVFGRKAHVRWCLGHYGSYIPATNLYVDSWGKRRR